MTRVLITGSRGFVGTHLVKQLEGRYEIFGIDRAPPDKENYAYISADILDKASVEAAVRRAMPDWVIHLAAQPSVKQSWENPQLTMSVNMEGTRNLLDAVAGLKPRTLIVSSSEVYGVPSYLPVDEAHPLHPASPYSESKLKQEEIGLHYFHRQGVPVIIVRSFPHTGPGQRTGFVCADFAKQIADIEAGRQESVMRVGNLSARRDMSDARDIAAAYELALLKAEPGEIYNICSGKERSIKSVLQTLLKLSASSITVEEDEQLMRKNDVPVIVGTSAKFHARTAWKPIIPFEQTLTDVLKFWRESTSA